MDHDELERDHIALKQRVKLIWAGLALTLSAAVGSLVTVAKGLYERGADDGAREIRLQHMEREHDRIREELRDMERRERRRSQSERQP